MLEKQPQNNNYLRHIFEFLFSLYIALVAKLMGNQKPNWFFSRLEYGEASVGPRMNAFLHLHPHSAVGLNGAFFVYAFAWAMCLFLLLKISSGTALAQRLLSSLGGIVSLLVLPLSWLYVSRLFGWTSFLPTLPQGVLFLELLAATLGAVMYLRAHRSLPIWGTAALLALHFVFWDAACFGPYFWRAPFHTIFVIAGFCSALAWSRYVSAQRGRAPEG
jgi:hypothetical protein